MEGIDEGKGPGLVLVIFSRSDCDGAVVTPAATPLVYIILALADEAIPRHCSFCGYPVVLRTGRVALSSSLRPRRGNLALTCSLSDTQTSRIASTPGTYLLRGLSVLESSR